MPSPPRPRPDAFTLLRNLCPGLIARLHTPFPSCAVRCAANQSPAFDHALKARPHSVRDVHDTRRFDWKPPQQSLDSATLPFLRISLVRIAEAVFSELLCRRVLTQRLANQYKPRPEDMCCGFSQRPSQHVRPGFNRDHRSGVDIARRSRRSIFARVLDIEANTGSSSSVAKREAYSPVVITNHVSTVTMCQRGWIRRVCIKHLGGHSLQLPLSQTLQPGNRIKYGDILFSSLIRILGGLSDAKRRLGMSSISRFHESHCYSLVWPVPDTP